MLTRLLLTCREKQSFWKIPFSYIPFGTKTESEGWRIISWMSRVVCDEIIHTWLEQHLNTLEYQLFHKPQNITTLNLNRNKKSCNSAKIHTDLPSRFSVFLLQWQAALLSYSPSLDCFSESQSDFFFCPTVSHWNIHKLPVTCRIFARNLLL